MDLGLAFEDDDLMTEKKNRNDDLNVPYNVKIYSPQWFDSSLALYCNGDTSGLDQEQVPHTFKFSGDSLYHKRRYQEAAEQYKAALDILPENQSSVRQDLRESLCRCYMHLGKNEESLNLAREIVTEMSTEDEAHQRQSLILMSAVCQMARQWPECVESLEKLCSLQPNYAQTWEQLGDAYKMLFDVKMSEKAEACDDCGVGVKDVAAVVNGTSGDECYVKPVTCYIRAKVLYEIVLSTASRFTRTRNEGLIEETDRKIKSIPFPESKIPFACEYIKREIEDQAYEKVDTTTQNPTTSVECSGETYGSKTQFSSHLFYMKFCSWYFKAPGS